MEQSIDQSKGENGDRMDICGDEEEDTGYLQDMINVDNLDQSMDSLKGSYNVPVFSMDQSNVLQRSQGFTFGGPSSQTITSSQQNISQGTRSDGVNLEVNPMPLFISSDTSSLFQNRTNQVSNVSSLNSQTQSVFNTGAFVMSLQNNAGLISFGQHNPTEAFSSDSVFTFGRESEGLLSNPGSISSTAEDPGSGVLGESKSSRGKHSGKLRQRKSRSQSSSSDNVPKIEVHSSSSPCKLDTVELQGTSEIGFKPSLLDEILTEKKMALMRSPEVIQFLQSQQRKITHGQHTES